MLCVAERGGLNLIINLVEKSSPWGEMERPLVQILVGVAMIQMRFFEDWSGERFLGKRSVPRFSRS